MLSGTAVGGTDKELLDDAEKQDIGVSSVQLPTPTEYLPFTVSRMMYNCSLHSIKHWHLRAFEQFALLSNKTS